MSGSEIRPIFLDAARSFASVLLWIKDHRNVIKTRVTAFDPETALLRVQRPADLGFDSFKKEVTQLGEGMCFFSVSLNTANIFFKASLLKGNNEDLVFTLPKADKIFKVQRRKELRFILPSNHGLAVTFQKRESTPVEMTKELFDISAGGLSFIIAENERSNYPVGEILSQMSLKIRGRPIVVDVEIRHVTSISRGNNLKVGTRFNNIRPGDAQNLATFVFEENRKIYTRFI